MFSLYLFFFLLMYMLFRCLGCRNFIQNPVFPIFNRSGFGTETDTYLYESSVVSLERNHVAFFVYLGEDFLGRLVDFYLEDEDGVGRELGETRDEGESDVFIISLDWGIKFLYDGSDFC